jgi:hypothetical protein
MGIDPMVAAQTLQMFAMQNAQAVQSMQSAPPRAGGARRPAGHQRSRAGRRAHPERSQQAPGAGFGPRPPSPMPALPGLPGL